MTKASEFDFDEADADWDEYYVEGSDDYESSFESKNADDEETILSSASKIKDKSLPKVYKPKWMEERDRKEAAREKETRERFQKLMELQKGSDRDSIKTVLTWDDEEKEETKDVEGSSSESSTHLCLKTIHISDSQLRLLNFHTKYPVPEDPGLVPAFCTLYPPLPSYKDDGIQKFVDLVEKLNLRPINSMKEMLRTDTLNFRYYGIDSRIMRAISESTSQNTSIRTIDFTGNYLTPYACLHLGKLFQSNDIITRLILSGCKIGAEGAENLEIGLSSAASLIDLDLESCAIGDDGLRHIASAICHSTILENVNLRDNDLRDGGAEYFSEIFLQTDSLKRLDLSWNFLYDEKFADTFFQGLSLNSTLVYLNMSGNGLGKETANQISSYLANSSSLREFDLSGNRFTESEANKIAKGLSKNTILETLRLGNNPLGASGAFALVEALASQKSPNLQLKILDLEYIWANKDILPLLDKIKRDRDTLKIMLDGIFSNYKLLGPDPKIIFLRRANFEAMSPKKKKQRKNFGHFVLTLKNEVVSSASFKDSVKSFGLKLTDSLIEEIAKAFTIAKGQIDQAALREFYLQEYPETRLPTPEPEEKSNKDVKKKNEKKK